MARFFEPEEIGDSILTERVSVIGFGNQGHAHALNLRDSGASVKVGLPEGARRRPAALESGFEVLTTEEAVAGASLVMVCAPDKAIPQAYRESIEPHLQPGAALLFCHGYHVHFGTVPLPTGVDVGLVAPSGPGVSLRDLYARGMGMPCLVAVAQDATGTAWNRVTSYAAAIGCGRAAIIESTFQEETETDLFGEQAVLVGGLMTFIRAGYETLVKAGYQPEVAYFECVHQVAMLAGMIQRNGIGGMLAGISDTAGYGALVAQSRLDTTLLRGGMQDLLSDVRSGRFHREWQSQIRAGTPKLQDGIAEELASDLQQVGDELRARMPFLRN